MSFVLSNKKVTLLLSQLSPYTLYSAQAGARISEGAGAREQRAESWLKYAARAQPPPAGCSFLRQPAQPISGRLVWDVAPPPIGGQCCRDCSVHSRHRARGGGRAALYPGWCGGGGLQLSWRVVVHSGACHNTLCPSCHTRPRNPALTSWGSSKRCDIVPVTCHASRGHMSR